MSLLTPTRLTLLEELLYELRDGYTHHANDYRCIRHVLERVAQIHAAEVQAICGDDEEWGVPV